MAKSKRITIETINKHYKRSGRFMTKWKTEAEEDLKFCLGEQWEQKIKEEIEKQGRPALTLNMIQPNIRLVTGYQRDSRSSIKAYPEGGEDSLTSDVVTALLKNIIKNSKAENVISEAFETCITARGKAFIEPYIDYTYDLLNGKLQFNVLDGWQVRIDPNSIKYDMSDARYLIKEKKLDKDALLELFPDKEDDIDEGIGMPLSEEDGTSKEENILEEAEDMPETEDMDKDYPEDEEDEDEKTHKFIEYYYKKFTAQYLAIDELRSIAQFFKTETQAKNHLFKASGKKTLERTQRIIPKKLPEIWVASCIGQKILEDKLSDSYPFWRSYPLIPLFGWYSAVGKRVLKREDLAYQGMASSLKDAQREKNKRRSQGLAIVNSVTNRGWIAEENSWVDKNMVKKQGASAGVTLEYKKGLANIPKELNPGGVPQSHIYFEEKSEEDIKKISGVNADMLSIEDKNLSGRAIALRQQQGLVVLKPLFDNLVWTQEILGKYMVSQLSELYTTEKALRVLGSEFIDKNFRKNESDIPEILYGLAREFVENLLNDPELANYDISIGEGLESPTERYAQYSGLLELAQQEIPIPPQTLIEYSDIPMSAKKEIISALSQASSPEPGAGKEPPAKKRS